MAQAFWRPSASDRSLSWPPPGPPALQTKAVDVDGIATMPRTGPRAGARFLETRVDLKSQKPNNNTNSERRGGGGDARDKS